MAQKAIKAIELATRLLEDIPPSGFASTVVLADELARVRDGEPSYVFHEYLTETNDGFWLTDFVERARQNGLAYVADAQFCRWEGYVPPELRRTVAKRCLDPIEAEETIDLLGHLELAPGARADLRARFPGKIVSVAKSVGDC